jgi:hypothetical protein
MGSETVMEKDRLKQLTSELQDFYLLSLRGIFGLVRNPFYFRDAIAQMDYAGPGLKTVALRVRNSLRE